MAVNRLELDTLELFTVGIERSIIYIREGLRR